jgi:hypothetical protein
MNYQKIYNLIVERAKNRSAIDGYIEKHHIIPRSLGGTNEKYNLVVLTAREHLISHLLLAKIYGGKMWIAAWMMYQMGRYNSRKYEWLKIEFAKVLSKIQKGRRRPPITDEHRRNLSEAKKR